MELPKRPSVVECKDLQEGGRYFEVLRGKDGSLGDYKVYLDVGSSSKAVDG